MQRLPVVVVTAAVMACGGCGGSSQSGNPTAPRRPTTSTPTTGTPTTRTVVAPPEPRPKRKPKPNPNPKPNPGSLPQTDQLPSAGTAQFHAEMAALWSGVTRNSLRAAMPAFFPEGAYAQVKGIADPRADYTARLVGDYQLDLAAAHALLGGQAQGAQLVGVEVPESYAHWVDPGACYNRVGYYEVPNARVIYRRGGQISSFGIASMISWRGVWYVVHLGAVLRPGAGGVVDAPSSGPGESAPSSTC